MKNKKIVLITLFVILILLILSIVIMLKNKLEDTIPGYGDYKFEIKQNGISRYYLVHIPSSYTDSPTPLVLNFHGGGGSPEGVIKMTNMNEHADKNNYIVVYPRGTREDGNIEKQTGRFWNLGKISSGIIFKEGTKVAEIDDVEFTRMVIEDISDKFKVDKNRIYATGLSNGAMFSYKLACELSDKIAAVAPVAGALETRSVDCNPTRPISILHFHGTSDTYAPYEGGKAECVLSEFISNSVEDSINFWVEENKCSLMPEITYANGEVICKTYSECKNAVRVELCTINGGGHTWPGGNSYYVPLCPPGKVTQDISANDEMWKFFQKYYLN